MSLGASLIHLYNEDIGAADGQEDSTAQVFVRIISFHTQKSPFR